MTASELRALSQIDDALSTLNDAIADLAAAITGSPYASADARASAGALMAGHADAISTLVAKCKTSATSSALDPRRVARLDEQLDASLAAQVDDSRDAASRSSAPR